MKFPKSIKPKSLTCNTEPETFLSLLLGTRNPELSAAAYLKPGTRNFPQPLT